MAVLSGLFPRYPSPSAGMAALRQRLPERALAALPISKVISVGAARAAAIHLIASPLILGQPLFPAAVQGRTLAWDTVSASYRIDTTLSGAPANGIRILIYTSNPFTGQPALPIAKTGYLDLTDKSTALTATLGTLLALGTTAVAQLDVTFQVGVVHGDSAVWVTSTGFIKDGSGSPVTFVFGDTAGVSTIGIGGVATGSDGTSVQALITIQSVALSLSVTARKGGNVIELNAVEGDISAAITGTVKFNGTNVATIGGTFGSPTFSGVSGRVLTSTQASGLAEILTGGVLIVSELSDLVLSPALVVFSG